MEEWFVLEAARFLRCSFIELWDHPQRHTLMSTAFTMRDAERKAKEVWKTQVEQKAKLNEK